MYFLKPEVILNAETISKVVQHGTVHGSPAGALLRLMTSVMVPRCLKDQSWPDTIKKEFTGQLHRFMASLTETAWDQRGTTTLYIPAEDLDNIEAAAKQEPAGEPRELDFVNGCMHASRGASACCILHWHVSICKRCVKNKTHLYAKPKALK